MGGGGRLAHSKGQRVTDLKALITLCLFRVALGQKTQNSLRCVYLKVIQYQQDRRVLGEKSA